MLDAAASVMKTPRFYSGRIQDPAHPSNDFPDPYAAFERVLIRAGSPAAYVQALIAFGLGSDSKTAVSARYAELAAIRGEAALLDAARQAIALLSQDPASLTRAHIRLLQQLRIGAPKAHEALRELVTGSAAIGSLTTNMVPNPTYLTWAVFERGAQVTMEERTFTLTTAPVRGNRPAAAAPVEKTVAIFEHRRTLEEASDGAVTIEESRVNQAAKLRRSEDLVRYEARIPDERVADVWFAAEVVGDRAIARETTGQESCDVDGRSLPCRWVRREYPGLRGGEEAVTLWFSDLVPGGVVRRLHETTPARGGSRTVSDARATSFSGTRKSNAPSVVANPDPRQASASATPGVAAIRAHDGAGHCGEGAAICIAAPSSSVREITAIPAGTTLVVKLLDGIDAKSRSGAFIRAALEQPLVVPGNQPRRLGRCSASAIGLRPIVQDRRQLAYFSRRTPWRSVCGVCQSPRRARARIPIARRPGRALRSPARGHGTDAGRAVRILPRDGPRVLGPCAVPVVEWPKVGGLLYRLRAIEGGLLRECARTSRVATLASSESPSASMTVPRQS